jgi:hypothetical protein
MSLPGLTRQSISDPAAPIDCVDARVEPGHDEGGFVPFA